jgi:hypothetical protein
MREELLCRVVDIVVAGKREGPGEPFGFVDIESELDIGIKIV